MVSSAAYEQDAVVDEISDEIGQTVSLVSQRAVVNVRCQHAVTRQ